MIFGAIPPPRNFAKIRTRGGRGLQPEQPKDSIPLGGTAERGGAGRRLCRSRVGAAERRRCAAAGRTRAGFSSGRRAAGGCAGRHGGRFRRGRGLAAWGPQRPRVGRDGAGRARFRAAGRGRYTAAFRGGRGEGAGRAALYGGRAGYIRGGGPIAWARRHRTGKKRSELRGLCRVTGHRWEWRQRRGRKGPFSLYKEALFAGARALSIQS